jgi:hypothetical protein
MRDRYRSLVATIATSALIACGDAAVGDVTAPPLAATPATPVANEWPSVDDYTENDIPSTIGLTIHIDPRFEDDYRTFAVVATVHFEWVNEVSASVSASLINQDGKTINQSSAGMQYTRLALPVAQGDTTLAVRISTNNITCGLVGKSTVSGSAAQKAIDFRLVQVVLFSQTISPTNGPDVLQPACVDVTVPPGGGGGDDYEVCYTVWRELWSWDYFSGSFTLENEWVIGSFCYVYNLMT